MRDPDFFLTVGDRLPVISATLLDPAGNPVDLTGVQGVAFTMALSDRSADAITGAAPPAGDPTTGGVAYAWADGDTLVAGDYDIEWTVTFSDGRQMTFPNDCPSLLRIRPRV